MALTNPNSFIDVQQLDNFYRQLGTDLSKKVDKETGKGLSTNDYTAAEKEKLAGIEAGANKYVHPNTIAYNSGFYKITTNAQGHVTAAVQVTKEDIMALGIPDEDTTYDPATPTTDGLMSAADKSKLDTVEQGANNYTHPAHTAAVEGFYKVTVDAEGHVVAVKAVTKADITALGIPAQDTTYGTATNTQHGLMSSDDKGKLDGIEAGANNYTHPSHTAATNGLYKVTVDGEGHVTATNSATKSDITALGIPAQDTTYDPATTSDDGLMSAADKTKLDQFLDASAYMLKSDVGSAMIYKGSVATLSDLPGQGNKIGDMWDVREYGMNYAWDGSKWDAMGSVMTISRATSADIDEIFAQTSDP